MNLDDIRAGLRVRVATLESTQGMCVCQGYLDARKLGACGVVVGYVPGHGGDVWFVRHNDDAIATYCFTELEPESDEPVIAINPARSPGP